MCTCLPVNLPVPTCCPRQAHEEAAKVQRLVAERQQLLNERQQLSAEREKALTDREVYAREYQHLKERYLKKSAALKEVCVCVCMGVG